MTEARKDLDEASRRDQKRLQLKREESRVMKETENTTKKFEITQELAEKEAGVNVCKIFEPITCHEQITRFLNSQPKVPNPNNYLNTSETEAIPPPPKDPGHAASSLNLNPMNHSSPSTTYPAEFSTSTN